jgi:hypothetical protein
MAVMAIQKQPDDISVDRPTLPPFHPQRMRERQDALAGAVTALVDNAEASGWTIAEIAIAMTARADEVILHEVGIEETNFLLRDILRR